MLGGRADYRSMERFCLEHCEGRLQEELLAAITGRGAFGRFKDLIHRHGIQDAWHTFRRACVTEAARAWLAVHEIAYRS
jgi:hypothetical protein